MGTPVSGPGQFSERTDKAVSGANASLPNAQYGENRDYQEQKSGAKMAQDSGQPMAGPDLSNLSANAAANVIGFGEPTAQPGTPVTDGADAGPGAGSEALSSSQPPKSDLMSAYLPALIFMANQPGSSDSARNLVRQIQATM